MAIENSSIVRAAFWSLADFLLVKVASFAVVMILARLLSPSDFGLIALCSIFVALATSFAESGLGHALVQSEEINGDDVSTVFWLNSVLGLVAAALLAFSAPLVASFFDEMLLVPLIQLMALIVIFGAVGSVHRSLLLRDLQYKKLAIVRVTATVISGIGAIFLATEGFGAFALAGQALVLTLISSMLYWLFSKWRPIATFKLQSARRLFSFGGFLFASSLLEMIYARIYVLLLGKSHSTSLLGQFGRAEATILLIQGIVSHPLGQVAFPTLSRMQEDPVQLRQAVSRGLRTSMLVNAAIMLGLGAVAEPFVLVIYGNQWLEMVPFLQILCLGGLLMPIHILNLNAIMALGHGKLFFLLDLLKKGFGIVLIVASSTWGPIGIAWGMVAAALFAVFVNMSQSSRLLNYSPIDQLRDVASPIFLGCVISVVSFASVQILKEQMAPLLLQLAAGCLIGGALWFVIAFGLDISSIRSLSKTALQGIKTRPAK